MFHAENQSESDCKVAYISQKHFTEDIFSLILNKITTDIPQIIVQLKLDDK